MSNAQFDHLDELAVRVAAGDEEPLGVLSTGERLYVILAANRPELLKKTNDTVAQALARLGEDRTFELVERWRYRSHPNRDGA